MAVNLERAACDDNGRLLLCPVCSAPLLRVEAKFQCANSHAFDVARQGYVNLLLEKPGAQVGDAKEMLQARSRFLESGHYQPLADSINDLIHSHLLSQFGQAINHPTCRVLDVGCGEGYYLGRLKQFLDRHWSHTACCYYGIDIAKEAVRMAASRQPGNFFIAQDAKEKILLAEGCVDVLLNIFAPRNPAEFARVLARDGLLLSVIPGPDHLIELRTAFELLSIEKEKQQKIVEQFADRFELIDSHTLRYEMLLDNQSIVNLVSMMPSYRHLSAQMSTTIKQQKHFQATAEFRLLMFEKRN